MFMSHNRSLRFLFLELHLDVSKTLALGMFRIREQLTSIAYHIFTARQRNWKVMFSLVSFILFRWLLELRTAGKRAVRILLECFLVWVNICCVWLGVDIWIQWYFSFNCHFSMSARCGCGFRAGFIRKYRQNELPEGGWLCARSHPWTEHQFRQQGWRGCLFELPFYTDESKPVQ